MYCIGYLCSKLKKKKKGVESLEKRRVKLIIIKYASCRFHNAH